MGFNTAWINELYDEYVNTRKAEILEKIIVACDPLMDSILKKYMRYLSYFEDIKQETRLILWLHLSTRSEEGLRKNLINPYVYLYFKLRWFVNRAFRKLGIIYGWGNGIQVDFSSHDRFVQSCELSDPEARYYLEQECPQELYKRCKKKLENHPILKKDSEQVRQGIKMIKQLIRDNFGKEINGAS